VLLRKTGKGNGLIALWYYETAETISNNEGSPWINNTVRSLYKWKLVCKKILEFEDPISEEFDGSTKISKRIPGLKLGFLQGDMRKLKDHMVPGYIDLILNQNKEKINSSFDYFNENKSIDNFLMDVKSRITKQIGESF